MKIKLAILGAGVVAGWYLDILKTYKNINLVGICSRTAQKAKKLKKKYSIKEVYENIDELYKNTKADIIISTVSADNIYKTSINLLDYPWTIFIEKPPGLNWKEFTQLKKISKLRNKKIYVGMNRRFYSSTDNLISHLKKSKGERTIYIFDQQDTDVEKRKKTPKKIISNWIYANSIHLIDYVSILARGKLKSIDLIYKKKKEICCLLKFNTGDMVNYIARWNKPGPWEIKVSTDNFYYEMNPLEQLRARSNKSRKYMTFESSFIEEKFKPGFKLQIDNLLLASRGLKHKLPSIEKLEFTMKLIKKIYSL
tara:strand:- start:692 stop:1621 length:930 start_codon:yes stop_codon:yes gene_type:complete